MIFTNKDAKQCFAMNRNRRMLFKYKGEWHQVHIFKPLYQAWMIALYCNVYVSHIMNPFEDTEKHYSLRLLNVVVGQHYLSGFAYVCGKKVRVSIPYIEMDNFITEYKKR